MSFSHGILQRQLLRFFDLSQNNNTSKYLATFLTLLTVLLPGTETLAMSDIQANSASQNTAEAKSELNISLTPAENTRQSQDTPRITMGETLPAQRVKELLRRFAPLPKEEQKVFRIPEQSLVKPPLPGIKTTEDFPPKISKIEKPETNAPTGPLKILRISPTGPVHDVTELSVSFSQPMVALGADHEADVSHILKLIPQPPGQWIWAGPQTLLFHPTTYGGRLPSATNYKVLVPASTCSVSGSALGHDLSVLIKTPAVNVTASYPSEGVPLSNKPIILLSFNQHIDRHSVLAHMKLVCGGKDYSIHMVNEHDVLADEEYATQVKGLDNDCWIAIQPDRPLPVSAHFSVVINKGCPTKEGPEITSAEIERDFTVHSPLAIAKRQEDGLTAGQSTAILIFNNKLASDKKEIASLISIEPALEDQCIVIGQNSIGIRGNFEPFKKYTMTVGGNLRDVFDGKLDHTESCSFVTGSRTKLLKNDQRLITIAPGQKPIWHILAQATPTVEVKIFRVTPGDWLDYSSKSWDLSTNLSLGTLLDTISCPVGNDLQELNIDLSPYLNKGHGQFVVTAQCLPAQKDERFRTNCWIQVTDLALDAFKGKELTAMATTLADGKPLPKAVVKLLPGTQTAVTDKAGQANFEMEPSSTSIRNKLLIVTRKNDTAFLPEFYSGWGYIKAAPTIHWYCVTDRALYRPGDTINVKGLERGLRFSSNESIQLFNANLHKVEYLVKGKDGALLARGEVAVNSDGGFAVQAQLPAKMQLGNVIIEIKAIDSDLKDFPTNAKNRNIIGNSTDVKNYSTSLNVGVEEYRRPEFDLKISPDPGKNILLGDLCKLTCKSSYFGGGPLPYANVTWTVRASNWNYTPPGWQQYVFGGLSGSMQRYRRSSPGEAASIATVSDPQGLNCVNLQVKSLAAPAPLLLNCEASVADVNRQQWSERTSIILHPAKTYVGLKVEEVKHQGDRLSAKAVTTDIDGKICPGRSVSIQLIKTDDGDNTQVDNRDLISSNDPSELSFDLPRGRSFDLIATVTDNEGRKNSTVKHINIAEIEQPKFAANPSQSVIIKPDKESYQPGDIANLTLTSPFVPAGGLLLISRRALVSKITLDFQTPTQTINIPITEDDYPSLFIEALLNGTNGASASSQMLLCVPPRAKALSLSVNPEKQELQPGAESFINVSLKGNNNLPVAGGHIALAVVDEAVLALRDNSWSDPINFFYANIPASAVVGGFRNSILWPSKDDATKKSSHSGGIDFSYRDTNLFQVEPSVLDERHYSAGREERHQLNSADRYAFFVPPAPPFKSVLRAIGGNSFNERVNFSELALFEPDIVTDSNGTAKVPIHLPDSTTKYRILAIATSGTDKYGAATGSIQTKAKLLIKPSLPRFLNFGDRCELPFVVQNQTDDSIQAEVVLRVQNASIVTGGIADGQFEAAGKAVTIAPHDRIELRFPIATKDEGKIDVQCAVVSNDISDAARLSIPVIVPATTEAFAAYGQIDSGAVAQKLNFPKNVYQQVGGLSIETSSTAVQSLTDAYLYLRSYQYACSEQLSSRLLAMLSLHDALVAFGKLSPEDDSQYKDEIQKTVDLLLTRQNNFGGFGLWEPNESTLYPFVSIQVAKSLFFARKKNFMVDQTKLDKCSNYLKQIRNNVAGYCDQETRSTLEAMALNVRYGHGDIDAESAKHVIARALNFEGEDGAESKKMTLETISLPAVSDSIPLELASWLLPLLSKDASSKIEADFLRRVINNKIKETASTASTDCSGYNSFDYLMFYSPRRADANVLEALIEDQPDSELIPKLAKGLLAHKKNGAWDGTQENSSVILALDKYFATYEKDTPNFEAQEWLGDIFVGKQSYAGRSTQSKNVSVPTEYLLQHKADEILINKTGPGRLYYRIGIDYALRDLKLKPASFGFTVSRKYEAIEKQSDVQNDSDGVWHIKAGATVRCKIHFSNIGPRYHVALADPLPAGAEPVNANLAGNQSLPTDKLASTSFIRRNSFAGQSRLGGAGESPIDFRWSYWRWRNWYEHQNMRDHQAEAFTSLLPAGEYDYSYLIRATTPGIFVVPPTKLEEMYSSETFGRTGTDCVKVE